MKRKKALYPGVAEAEQERERSAKQAAEEQPHFIGGKPNYNAFPGWPPEKVIAFLNID